MRGGVSRWFLEEGQEWLKRGTHRRLARKQEAPTWKLTTIVGVLLRSEGNPSTCFSLFFPSFSRCLFSCRISSSLARPRLRSRSPLVSRSLTKAAYLFQREWARIRRGYEAAAPGWPGSPVHRKGGNQRLASGWRGTCGPRRGVYPIERRGMAIRERETRVCLEKATDSVVEGETATERGKRECTAQSYSGRRGEPFPPFKNDPEGLLYRRSCGVRTRYYWLP